jgi:hypothetical protein
MVPDLAAPHLAAYHHNCVAGTLLQKAEGMRQNTPIGRTAATDVKSYCKQPRVSHSCDIRKQE